LGEKNKGDIKKYVPMDYQHFSLSSVENEFKKNLARIAAAKNATSASLAHASPADVFGHLPPMVLTEVVACSTK
jgi:hypothetical protein